jgi:nucleoside phosphorylase
MALEMEASAFLTLCVTLSVHSLGVVKGVSDLGNSDKGKDPGAYKDALVATATAAQAWITHTLQAVSDL